MERDIREYFDDQQQERGPEFQSHGVKLGIGLGGGVCFSLSPAPRVGHGTVTEPLS